VIASADPASERLTLYSSTQVPHHIRRLVGEELGLAESRIRVIAPDVGGGFGYKGSTIRKRPCWPTRRGA